MPGKKSDKEAYLALVEEAQKHDAAYFDLAKPLVSDYDYDQLIKKIEKIEQDHPEWTSAASPTQKVSEAPTKGFVQVKHRTPMLSLANTYSEEEVEDFFTRIHKWTGKEQIPFCAELKMDGVAVAIRYEKGRLVQALTRGDGKKGDDITNNVRMIPSVPQTLKGAPDILEVRGEAYMSHKAFREANKKKEEAGQELWANPRNATAGSLKLLDPKEVKQRNLSVAFYGVAEDSHGKTKSQFEWHKVLASMGLPTSLEKHRIKTDKAAQIFAFMEEIEKERKDLGFDIDGIVIKVDDMTLWQELGATGKSPRWAVAYKFAPEQAETKIEDITVQVGRTGVLTPVAELKPVPLAGSRISRATLHNREEIERKDIRIGDTVLIEKGGDVIPKVVAVHLKKRPKGASPWKMPEQCPICGSDVVHREGEVAVRCPNPECGHQVLRRLTHFASKNAMDIDHMGPKVVEQLVEHGLVKSIADIYELSPSDLAELEGFKEKSIDNLVKSIEASKQTTLPRLIFSLGIPFVGEGVAELLADRAGDLSSLADLTEEELTDIEGIGEKVAESVIAFFAAIANQREVERLLALGVKPQAIKKQTDHPFSGKSFVITGTLESFGRAEAASLIKERGGSVSGSVSKKTDYLLLGDSPGSKYDKAKKLGVAILSETEFEEFL